MAEGCTHHRQCEDIGTVKLPRWIREYTGKKLNFETSSGGGFPKEMAYRIAQARDQKIPIVNYGTLIAHLKGVLKRSISSLPGYENIL